METPAATSLTLSIVSDVHARGEQTEVDAANAGTFGQLLENEIAFLTSDPGPAAAADLLGATAAPLTDESTQCADGAQMLDPILDAASMVSTAAIAALTPDVKSVAGDAEGRPLRAQPSITAPVNTSIVAARQEIHTDAAQLTEMRGARLLPVEKSPDAATPADIPAIIPPQPEAAPLHALPAQRSAETRAWNPAPLLDPSDSRPASGDTSMGHEKTATPGTQPVLAASAAPRSAETKETRDVGAPQLLDAPLLARAEANLEQRQLDRFPAASATDKLPLPDAAAQPTNSTSSLDALSSAAVMPKWTPATHPSTDPTASAPATARIDPPVGTDSWGDALRQKVVWLVDRQQQSAEIHVNPPHLGPVEVMLNLSEDGARIVFCSPHASVREAIEASLAELRLALANNGLSLGQALVSADPGAAREHLRQEMVRNSQDPASSSADSSSLTESQAMKPLARGLIDIFA